jgi:UDP-glucuronate 4-epimerase
MRILVTGSSGQIGTNLAQRLQREGHDVFGVDKRLNTWTDDFRYLLQDLSGHYPSFPDGIGGVEYPEVDLVVHLAAHAKVHQLVRQPHRALENAVMTFNVLEFCRQRNLPIVFSSSREVYGDVHRFAATACAISSSASRTSTGATTTISRAWCGSCRSSSTRCSATSR